MQHNIVFSETSEKKTMASISGKIIPEEEMSKRSVPRNLQAKKQMVEQLMTLGLSKESIARILHIRLNDENP